MKYIVSVIIISLAFTSCKRSFEPIQYGQEACSSCKMTIVDPQYAAEMITTKGRVYKFDDVACMKHFITEHNIQDNGLMLFVADFDKKHFIDARIATYYHNEYFRSPMNGGYGAFSSANDANEIVKKYKPDAVTWINLK